MKIHKLGNDYLLRDQLCGRSAMVSETVETEGPEYANDTVAGSEAVEPVEDVEQADSRQEEEPLQLEGAVQPEEPGASDLGERPKKKKKR